MSMIKKYYICFTFVLVSIASFAQKTPDNLINGSEASKLIPSKSIFSNNKKVSFGKGVVETSKSSTLVSQSSVASMTAPPPPPPLIPHLPLPTSQAGTTPAEFSVAPSGAATYNVPITVPPGVRDITPDIGLSFNSQVSNGLAGWGWNISGLSSISRVSSTHFHDEQIDGVDFDENDRFAMDGKRLLLKSGTYGAADSEYVTEVYSNIKIKAYGTSPYGAGYGPSYFIVYFPDGSRVWYGSGGSNARSRMEWSIGRRMDPQGNSIFYNYVTDGELRAIDRISYGGNGTAQNDILFYYRNRKRPESGYVAGREFKRKKILERIETKSRASGAQLYRKYELSHSQTNFGYERLVSIKEFNKDDESASPITFSYDNSTTNLYPETHSSSITPGYNYQTDAVVSGEFDGDGNLDFILYNKNTRNQIHIFDNLYGASGGLEIGRTYNLPKFDAVIGNNMLNHEGKKLAQQGISLIYENKNDNVPSVEFKNYYSSVTGLHYHYSKTWNAPTYNYDYYGGSSDKRIKPVEYVSGDFNGDGLTDVLAVGKPYTTRYCHRTSYPDDYYDYQEDYYINYYPSIYSDYDEYYSDVHGGGGSYSCNTSTSNYKSIYFIDLNRNLSSGFTKYAGSLQEVLSATGRVLAADFNGDGKTDLFHFSEGKLYVYELNNNSQLSLIHTESDSYIKMDRPILLGDYNGDGKTDFVIPTAYNSKNWRFFLSMGSTIYKYTKNIELFTYAEDQVFAHYNYKEGPITNAIGEFKFIAQDVNGDGKTDLIKHLIVSAHSSNHSYSDDIVNIHVNVFGENDTTPSFEHTSNFTRSNTGVSKYGFPIALNIDQSNDNIEYAYISANSLSAYKFEGNHRRDVTLKQITNNGKTYQIDYSGLTTQGDYSSQIYAAQYDQIYPYVNINTVPSLKLVGKIRETAGGITRTQDFSYSGAVTHASGLGFLGFKQVKKTNIYGDGVQTLWNITDFNIQKRGAPIRNWVALSPTNAPNSFINKTEYTYNTQLGSDKLFINVQSQVVSEDALTGVTNTKTFSYDPYYSPTMVKTTFPGGSVTIEQHYTHNPSPFDNTYAIGRLAEKATINVLHGDTFTASEKYSYSNNLVTEVRRKGHGTPWLHVHYQYDAFGNVLQKTVSAEEISDRTENFEFDSSGKYMIKSIDVEGLETTYTYDMATGNPTKVTSAYGLPITYLYDAWGRVKKETDYLGKGTFITYASNTDFGAGGVLKTINYEEGQDEKVYYNALGWVMKEGVLSINNKWIFKSYEYDVAGKKLKESEPYFSTSSPSQWNQYAFDEYGRPITQQLYTGKIINTTYNGLSATVTDGIKTVTSTKDALGNIISVEDEGGTINYTYYANGKMKSTNYGDHVINVTIDGWGRKTALSDPSAGTFTYQYNILGELLEETTPKGTTSYQYNVIGKLVHKEIVGDQTNIATNYEYDATTKLLKRMRAIDSKMGINYDYNYYYDSNKRLSKVTEDNGTANFEKQLNYDGYGRVNREVYITNSTTTGVSSTVSIKNVYDTNTGILKEIKEFNINERLWRINTEDARGNALSISLGNGIIKKKEYDQFGFLTNVTHKEEGDDGVQALKIDYDFDAQRGILNSRKNYAFTNWDEGFTYDNLDRLTQISGAVNHEQAYDDRGRITDNSFVGAYNYNNATTYQLANIDLNTQGDLYYQQNKLQQITYNAFKKPVKIFQEDHGRVDFSYGPFMNRTHAYYGGLEEDISQRRYHKQYSSIIPVEIVEDLDEGSTKIITYVGGDAYTAPIAYIREQAQSVSINGYHYLHRDYLGSILAISNSSAEIVEQRQFGAWGLTDQFASVEGGITFDHNSLIGRGFTGHEHFFDVSLIHMNGRMYDAKLGRFLSPDNFIQDPYNTQSFNRYGYVWNNPLSYNDPSGEILWMAVLAGAIVGAISGAAAYIGYVVQTGNWSWGGFAMAVLGGALVGGITGAIAPGIFPAMITVGYFWAAAATAFVSSFLPSFSVPVGDWNVNISPSIAFGNASGIGASLSVGYNDRHWSFSGGIGYMHYGNYNGFGNGVEIRKSILAAYDDGRTGFSLGTNWWSGNLGGGNDDFHQRTGVMGFRHGDFKLRYENDGGAIIKHLYLGDRGDSYRTASLQLSAGDFSAGFRLFTGKRDDGEESKIINSKGKLVNPTFNPQLRGAYGRKFKHGFANEVGTPYRLGALTFGYKGFRIGTNSEHIRHAIQNRFIHNAIGDRGFRNMSWDWQGIFQYRTENTFTSW